MLSILSVHNYYQQPGGEDRVFASESALLEQNGHTVLHHEDHNYRIAVERFEPPEKPFGAATRFNISSL